MKEYKIVEFEQNKYKDKVLTFRYTTDKYYDVIQTESEIGWTINYELKAFSENQNKSFDSKLFEEYIINPLGYGLEVEDKIVGWLVLGVEDWARRLRVWTILLDEEYRRYGFGNILMNKAKEVAESNKLRLVILETQTCNYKAIQFYFAQGFKFVGTDFTCYSNNDVEKKEVRIELGYFLE